MPYRVALAVSAFALSLSAAAADIPPPAAITKQVQKNILEYFELLAMPNDAINADDIKANAAWLEKAFQKRGFTTKQLDNNGKPLVYAEYDKKLPGARTVLFYMHFDGQPVLPDQWAQKSPWVAVVKQRKGSNWEIVDPSKLQATPLDPDLRVFARSSSDDKGPIEMFLTAFDALAAANMAPVINVKVILDSEEEKGSINIGKVATANKALLKSDLIVIHDSPKHASEKPTLVFGNRGNTVVTLTVYGPKNPLHSGHYGNYVANPAQRLATLLASMKDDEGRVTIPGYYDGVKITDADRKIMAAVPDDEAGMRKRFGVKTTEKVGANYQDALQYPSLNIRGMQAAAVGEKGANIIPNVATAELDLRTTPEAPPERLMKLIEDHMRSKGYYIAKGAPTDEERAEHDKIASLKLGRGSRASRTAMDSPEATWAYTALKQAGNTEPVRIRMMGGSVPTDKLVDALEEPFIIIPLVNGDNNQHSYDENMRMGHFVEGVKTIATLVRTP